MRWYLRGGAIEFASQCGLYGDCRAVCARIPDENSESDSRRRQNKLRRALEDAASRLKVNYTEFLRKRNVRDHLTDVGEANGELTSDEEVAAATLCELCVGDIKRMDQVVMIAVFDFLQLPLDDSQSTGTGR